MLHRYLFTLPTVQYSPNSCYQCFIYLFVCEAHRHTHTIFAILHKYQNFLRVCLVLLYSLWCFLSRSLRIIFFSFQPTRSLAFLLLLSFVSSPALTKACSSLANPDSLVLQPSPTQKRSEHLPSVLRRRKNYFLRYRANLDLIKYGKYMDVAALMRKITGFLVIVGRPSIGRTFASQFSVRNRFRENFASNAAKHIFAVDNLHGNFDIFIFHSNFRI